MAELRTVIWFAIVLGGGALAVVILMRRGRRGVIWALLAFGGAVLSRPVIEWNGRDHEFVLVGLIGLGLLGLGCIGLRRRRVTYERCMDCGYSFAGSTEDSSGRCPECGTPRPALEGHCLECKADIRNAIAGGTIVCPHCGAAVPDRE